MSEQAEAILKPKVVKQGRGPRVGSWIGAALCAAGISASFVLLLQGAALIAGAGGFVASGGPYAIKHPITPGMWGFPVGMTGMFVLPALHMLFADRIEAPGLVYATWCAAFTLVGGLALSIGIRPPGGEGLAWGYIIMGVSFLAVGIGSILLRFTTSSSIAWKGSGMTGTPLIGYRVMTVAALVGGVFFGRWLGGV